MWYPAKLTQAATQEPVAPEDAKRQLRIDFEDDDEYIDGLIAAARDHVEKYCNILLATQTVEIKCDCWRDFSRLPVAPVQSVSSVTYTATDGTTMTLDPSFYEVRADGLEGEIVAGYGKQWPATQPKSRISVSTIVGYAAAPSAVRHAILLLIGHWYENREAVTTDQKGLADLPMAVDALLSNYRRGA